MSKSIAHFGVHNAETGQPIAVNANAGDTLLFQATRDLFTRFLGEIDWKMEALWKPVDLEKVNQLNTERDAILIGGGGLFLRDQAGADAAASGWQWNCPTASVQALDKPLVVFGVGYNRFRDQKDFDSAFAEQISAVVDKSTFFGLRNHGSRYAIRRYLPTSLHHRVRYQPCPTTVAWHIYPDLVQKAPLPSGKKLVLNAAFDRRDMRFGEKGREEALLTAIARVVGIFAAKGWEIILANHKPQDAEIGSYLERESVAYTAVDLAQTYPEDIIKFYLDKDVTIGMRGHAQMIPFGLRRKIVSIISHDKIGWFLDDIGHPEWGVDVEDAAFEQKLESTIRSVTESKSVANEIEEAQKRLWHFTEENMAEITERLA